MSNYLKGFDIFIEVNGFAIIFEILSICVVEFICLNALYDCYCTYCEWLSNTTGCGFVLTYVMFDFLFVKIFFNYTYFLSTELF